MCVSVSRRSSQCFTLTGSDHIRRLPAPFARSASGTLYTDTNCRWGPWTRCIMANNAVNVSTTLSWRIIPVGAGLNQWYTPRAKLLKTPLGKATGPACRFTLNKYFKGSPFSCYTFCSRSLTEQTSSGIAGNPLNSFTKSAQSTTWIPVPTTFSIPTTFTHSSTTCLVGSWILRGGGAGLGGGCESPGAWTAALALDFLPGMSHKRGLLRVKEAITWILRAQKA